MPMTHTLAFSLNDGTSGISATVTMSINAQLKVDESFPSPSTNALVGLELDVSQTKYLVVLADQALTLKFNDSTTPTPTVVLAAGEPYVWRLAGTGHPAFTLTVDVTALYVTNASGTTARLRIWEGHDPTV